MSLLLLVLVIVLVFAALGYTNQQRWGYYGYSPLLILLVILLILWATGVLH